MPLSCSGTSAPRAGRQRIPASGATGVIRGVPPAARSRARAGLQRALVAGGAGALIRSAHDCAEGGVAVTLAECWFRRRGRSGRGIFAVVAAGAAGFDDVATLFGESASRAVVSVAAGREQEALELARRKVYQRPGREAGSAAIACGCRWAAASWSTSWWRPPQRGVGAAAIAARWSSATKRWHQGAYTLRNPRGRMFDKFKDECGSVRDLRPSGGREPDVPRPLRAAAPR